MIDEQTAGKELVISEVAGYPTPWVWTPSWCIPVQIYYVLDRWW